MRKKALCEVVAFHSTADAFALEEAARAAGLMGRLIPVPRQITAGCGLAWSEPAANRNALAEMIQKNGLRFELMREMVL